MAAIEAKADKLIASASAGGFFAFLSNKEEKWDNAKDLYTEAASAYKLEKKGRQAGLVYEKIAKLQETKLEDQYNAAISYGHAALAYKSDSNAQQNGCLEDAVRVLERVVVFCQKDVDRFSNLAIKHLGILSEVYELMGNRRLAVEALERAASTADSASLGPHTKNKHIFAAVELRLRVPEENHPDHRTRADFSKAERILENLIEANHKDQSMRWQLANYCYKAGLCHLACEEPLSEQLGGKQQAENASGEPPLFPLCHKYAQWSKTFFQSNEFKLLNWLYQATINKDHGYIAAQLESTNDQLVQNLLDRIYRNTAGPKLIEEQKKAAQALRDKQRNNAQNADQERDRAADAAARAQKERENLLAAGDEPDFT